jgi:hypothetical protein
VEDDRLGERARFSIRQSAREVGEWTLTRISRLGFDRMSVGERVPRFVVVGRFRARIRVGFVRRGQAVPLLLFPVSIYLSTCCPALSCTMER